MSYGDKAHGAPGNSNSDIPFDMDKIDALPKYVPGVELKTMKEVLGFVREIDETKDEYATIVSMLEIAHGAAARIMEEELRK